MSEDTKICKVATTFGSLYTSIAKNIYFTVSVFLAKLDYNCLLLS